MASSHSDARGYGRRQPYRDVAARLTAHGGWGEWPDPIVVSSTPTTMAMVREAAERGAPEGTAVIAEEQTRGRGRHSRVWESPLHCGLWVSVLWRPPTSAPLAGALLPLVAGLAVTEGLRSLGASDVALKWPNDVVVESAAGVRKLAGILAERLGDGAVVMGIGLNVLQSLDELPPGGSSLLVEVPDLTASRDEVAAVVLASLAQGYRRWCTGSWSLEEYRARCLTLGRVVTVHHVVDSAREDITGRARDVDDQGRLLVDDDGGGQGIAVSAGDVTLRSRGAADEV